MWFHVFFCISFFFNFSFLCFSELTSELKVKPPGRSQIGKKKKSKKISLFISSSVHLFLFCPASSNHLGFYFLPRLLRQKDRHMFTSLSASSSLPHSTSTPNPPSVYTCIPLCPSHPPIPQGTDHCQPPSSLSSPMPLFPLLTRKHEEVFHNKPHAGIELYFHTHRCIFLTCSL